MKGFGIILLVPTIIIRSNKNDLVSKTKSKQTTEKNRKQNRNIKQSTYLAGPVTVNPSSGPAHQGTATS